MSPATRALIQLAGAGLFFGVAVVEALGLKAPTFTPEWSWMIYAGCSAYLAFLAWRTWSKAETEERTETSKS